MRGMGAPPIRPTSRGGRRETWPWGGGPYFKLHGSSRWKDEQGEPVLIMGSAKSGAIDRFPVLKAYHDNLPPYARPARHQADGDRL